MRILALDVGTKTIGVAVSNAEETLALGVTTLPRKALKDDCEEVRKLAASRGAGLIVVGWPLTPRGEEGRAVERTRAFVEALKESAGLPVETWDERYTTAEAASALREREHKNPRRGKGKPNAALDAVAAALILESYLESRRQRAASA